ncbi:class I SAM-dependent methyltransferase [Castellaniella sp. GW247-6E4]|uniref:class I SAM-dependent methyltransferase n=1 Tax=Castellaniella sp. GW247-6E4 TaxID=3140380 RepID=UPI003314B422
MNSWNFHVGSHNRHYEGAYGEQEIRWRAVCAEDKAENIKNAILSSGSIISSVLEVGCGTGSVLGSVRRRGVGVNHVGIDVADPHAHVDSNLNTENIILQVYDGVKIPYSNSSFDLVFATHVLEHVQDERGFLFELKRVSRKYVYVEVPCEINIRTSVQRLQTTLNIGHINAYTPETFALTIETSGLRIKEIFIRDHSWKIHSFYGRKIPSFLKMMTRRAALSFSPRFATKMFCYHVGALCELEH